MRKTLKEYALELAEDYVDFKLSHGWYDEVMRPEAYARGRINNDMETIIAEIIENLQAMGE
jgi:hypothetical protein